jgi:hypothetical protein
MVAADQMKYRIKETPIGDTISRFDIEQAEVDKDWADHPCAPSFMSLSEAKTWLQAVTKKPIRPIVYHGYE